MKLWRCAYVGVAAFAAVFVWLVGHRGTFLLDQSILFDGAWRVYQGQVPYRDFFSAFPPVPFFIQALFFRITSVDFSAMVLAAAMLNGVAALCVIWLLRRLVPDSRALALVAGLLTAVWFQAPFGTLWFEQTAFFFNLLALVLLVKSELSSTGSSAGAPALGARAAVALRVLAGVLLSVAMLSKQNAGAEFVPVALGVVVVPRLPRPREATRSAAQLLAGLLLGFALFAIWLWTFSSPADFWHCYVELARQIGGDRIRFGKTIVGMLFLVPTWQHMLGALVALAWALVLARRTSTPHPRLGLIAWIIVACVFYQNLFKLHTDNDVENALPYTGLIYGLSVGLLWQYGVAAYGRISRHNVAWLSSAALGLGILFYAGLHHSWDRSVQEFRAGTTFSGPLQVPGMSRVKWGNPTPFGLKTMLSQQDFEALNAWLAAADANFFVFPDTTLLYGLHQRISPQPWLYFSPGHSFLERDLLDVDARVVAALRRNDVRIVILEKDSWPKNQDLWRRMPQLSTWINTNFELKKEFGIYQALSHVLSQSR